jgi:hypothetical protein
MGERRRLSVRSTSWMTSWMTAGVSAGMEPHGVSSTTSPSRPRGLAADAAGVTSPLLLAALIAGLVVALGGCAGSPGPGTSAASRSPQVALDGHGDADEDLPPLPAPPIWDADSRQAATRVAGRVMRAFARPDASAASWWAQLEPLLSPAARTAYAGTDPANVPASAVAGPAVLLTDTDGSDAESPWLARVEVPTDVGAYVVLLSRSEQDAPWLAERLTPPAALGAP